MSVPGTIVLIISRAYGVLERAIPLPRNVDTDSAEASCKKGVLTISLPKLGGEREHIIPYHNNLDR